jgi:hypothetical protein
VFFGEGYFLRFGAVIRRETGLKGRWGAAYTRSLIDLLGCVQPRGTGKPAGLLALIAIFHASKSLCKCGFSFILVRSSLEKGRVGRRSVGLGIFQISVKRHNPEYSASETTPAVRVHSNIIFVRPRRHGSCRSLTPEGVGWP